MIIFKESVKYGKLFLRSQITTNLSSFWLGEIAYEYLRHYNDAEKRYYDWIDDKEVENETPAVYEKIELCKKTYQNIYYERNCPNIYDLEKNTTYLSIIALII
ncbi:MAG: hypothetical protein ABIL20_05695 [candidate division WOR-3 bacterium]